MVTETVPASRRAWRRARARELAAPFGGLVHRRDLRAAGICRDEVRSELRGQRWTALGRHTIGIDTALVPEHWPARAAWAVWETGSGAVLDGVSALLAAGLENYTEEQIVVAVPRGTCPVRLPGVRVRSHRVITPAPVPGLPRLTVEAAVVNATTWAVSERQAALIVILAVQQRLTTAERLTAEVHGRRRVRRRAFLRDLLREVGGGVQALGELDFARLCRQHGLPEPSRQRVCRGPRGRIYLDVWWEELRVGVEIDGVQHQQGLNPVEDALRDNEVRLRGGPVLRIPSLGLLTDPGMFMGQVRELLTRAARAR
ncbi:hypothetical protein [Ruania albidiflava]|uniref:hypothetical protein n=1 Tax=Ruania albidiflava TaxID=366586 RepID=UPI0023F37743|nr:hypothetical protein [Ruania albidiflava]